MVNWKRSYCTLLRPKYCASADTATSSSPSAVATTRFSTATPTKSVVRRVVRRTSGVGLPDTALKGALRYFALGRDAKPGGWGRWGERAGGGEGAGGARGAGGAGPTRPTCPTRPTRLTRPPSEREPEAELNSARG